jgi:cytochrome P450
MVCRAATMGKVATSAARWIIPAANRDPNVFPEPGRFLSDRHSIRTSR